MSVPALVSGISIYGPDYQRGNNYDKRDQKSHPDPVSEPDAAIGMMRKIVMRYLLQGAETDQDDVRHVIVPVVTQRFCVVRRLVSSSALKKRS